MTIVNITADFPDAINSKKTGAVKLLLNGSSLDHFVISINRSNNPFSEVTVAENKIISIKYFALPFGLLSRIFLRRVANKVLMILKNENIMVDHIVAHKFSVDGVVAYYLAEMYDVPFSCSLWGSTDKRFVSFKIFTRRFYKKIYTSACFIFPASPWIYRYFTSVFGNRNEGVYQLPIVTKSANEPSSLICDSFRLVTVFNLNLYKLKGLPNLLKALSLLKHLKWSLDIYGNGSEENISKINEIIKKLGLTGRVNLLGVFENNKVIDVLKEYHSFLLPTTSETFGMVYIEAVFSGLPILYSENQGIDGYFDDVSIGVRVNPFDVSSIEEGILDLFHNYPFYKDELSEVQNNGFLNIFRQKNICDIFDQCISSKEVI